MSNNPKQPKKDDAVLGGAAPNQSGGVILGGLEGAKQRLNSTVVEARISALAEAIDYGEAGLDLVVGALQDESKQVRRQAYLLLRQRKELQIVRALQEYKTWDLFERFYSPLNSLYSYDYVNIFGKREIKEFEPEIGISDTAGIAYAFRCEYDDFLEITDKLAGLLQDPQASKLEALVFGPWVSLLESGDDSSALVNALVAAKEKLPNLKALFLGDISGEEYEISWIRHCNISPILKAYPNLEMLQIRGGDDLAFSPARQENLEILVVETGGLSRETIAQICALELPALEHLELWLGSDCYGGDSSIEDLMPILAGDLFPHLTYLGLRNSEYSDKIAAALVESPILQQISILDLSMGTLGDEGALALLDCPAINEIDILNVSENYLSEDSIEQLQELDCQVIADEQKEDEYEDEEERYCSVAE
ncbi:MAG: HEAT repeat domain-containing protein [Oscillatoria sp. SIO1A7]|nr:HEAT repeat domain-containing protein [Oscillatoria sp. SIO1A7]